MSSSLPPPKPSDYCLKSNGRQLAKGFAHSNYATKGTAVLVTNPTLNLANYGQKKISCFEVKNLLEIIIINQVLSSNKGKREREREV